VSGGSPLTLDTAIAIPREVMAREVGEETVLLDLASGSYFGLDALGTRIWQLLVAGSTLAQVRDALLDEYEVGRDQLEADLLRLLDELHAAGLVRAALS
jgi:Coenzyme PQQ synthesis protein D (PqqD)